ncbi:MAG: dienelactone hydrolase family protein [Pyrinomonadaceae bacterium]|nr:dienelactone hydrolase family protein [Pyrinomonadaceae bacterium]
MIMETLQFETANGATTAYVAAPDDVNAETPTVILIQEYWGINDNIKSVANRYAEEGFIAVTPDLYRGKLAATPDEAMQLMQALPIEDGVDTIKNAVEKAREMYKVSKFGISGFCMGGTFALRAACDLPEFAAAAPFYGDIPPEEVLKTLKTPTIFFAGTKDAWINPEKVAQLQEITDKYELPVETVSYEADHAFFNNTNPKNYDANAAEDAWAKTIQLFKNNLQ